MIYQNLTKFRLSFIFISLLLLLFISGCDKNVETDVENSDMGYIQEDVTSTEIPSDLIGTWEVSDQLPPGLKTYKLTFNENGQVVQESEITDQEETTETSKFIMENNTIKILDPNNTVLMSLNYEDGNLTTMDLGDSAITFVKTS